DRPRELLPRRRDLLHQADAICLVGGELVAGEQPALRVGPADLARKANGGAADGVNPALDLDLPEAGVRRGDADVGREEQLDPDREAGALHRADDGLRDARTDEAERVERAFGDGHAPLAEGADELGEIEAGGEVIAVRVEDDGAHLRVSLRLEVRAPEVLV